MSEQGKIAVVMVASLIIAAVALLLWPAWWAECTRVHPTWYCAFE